MNNAGYAAAVAAEAEHVARCAVCVQGYRHDTASVSEKQAYADCIYTLHPRDFPKQFSFLLGLCLIGVSIGTAIGGVHAAMQEEEFLFGCMSGFVLSLCGAFFVAMAVCGVLLMVAA